MGITTEELTAVFRQAIAGGDVSALYKGRTWHDVYCGDVSFRICKWVVVIFNDCNSVDYIDEVWAPDGRYAQYDDLPTCPFDALTVSELDRLTEILRQAKSL